MGHSVARVQKVQRVQRGRLTAFQAEGCGIALTGDKFCMPPKAAGLSLLRSRILFSDVCRLIV